MTLKSVRGRPPMLPIVVCGWSFGDWRREGHCDGEVSDATVVTRN